MAFYKKKKKASSFRFTKKNLFIDILFLQTRQKNNANVLTGSSSVAEDSFQRPQETKITTMQSCMLQRSKVGVVTAGHDCLTGTYIAITVTF